ncbi:MAG: acetylxylan esterase [Tidjanibacter sp.]|nr:acetylxylan esterase [Tidjanibacter sp.]
MKRAQICKIAMLVAVAVVVSGAWSTLRAQETMEDLITLTLDRWDGRYNPGEEVAIHAVVPEEFEAVREIWVNGLLESSELVVVEKGEYDILTRRYDVPTTVMLKFRNPDKKQHKDFTDIGYCVGMEHFRPGFEKPADFMEWWRAQVAELRELPIEAKIVEVEVPKKDAADYVCYDIEVNCGEGGAPVRGYLAMPKGATPGSLPICIYTHGAGVNGGSNRSKIDVALRYARHGSISLDLNAHGMLNGQPQSYYDKLNATTLKGYKDRPIENREDYYFRGMYLRLQRALDWLCTLPEWNGERVLVIGNSQGGAQTAAICGLDNRVTHAVIREPGMMDLGGRLVGRMSGPPCLVDEYGITEEFLKWGPYFDTAFFLEHSTAKIIFECGWVDMSCTPSSMLSGYNLAGGEKTIYTYPYRRHQSPRGKYREPWNSRINKQFAKFISDALK